MLTALASLLEHVADAMMLCDAEGNVVGMSPSARSLHGLAVDESAQIAAENYRQQFTLHDPESGKVLSLDQSQMGAPDQSPPHQLVVLSNIRNGRNHLLTFDYRPLESTAGIFVITMRAVHGTGPLEESERRLRTVIEALPVGLWFTDAEGRIVLANAAGQRIWAGARYVAPEDFAQYQARWAATGEPISAEEWGLYRALRGEESYDEIIEIETFDGARKIVRNSALPFRDDEGRIIGALAINEDITAQWQAQEERERLSALVSSTTDAVIWKTTDGTITAWNHGAEEMFGFTSREAIGAPISIIIPEERRDEGAWLLALLKRGDALKGYETERRRKDGSRLWISLSLSPIRNAAGRIVGAATIERDISKSKETERRLAEHAEALEAADRRRDELLAVLAHEMRNPLAPVATGVELLSLQDSEGRFAELAKTMSRQIGLMTRLLDDLMDVSRLSRGLMSIRKQPTDLQNVVDAAVETARPILDERGHRLQVSVLNRPVHVLGDRQRLTQVLVNLLINAAKYTHPGGNVSVTVSVDGNGAAIRVQDDGIGMSSQAQPHIFDLFHHPERVPQHASRGLGLGLTLVRRIVEAHGGSVRVRSAGPGTGSEFVVVLPLAD